MPVSSSNSLSYVDDMICPVSLGTSSFTSFILFFFNGMQSGIQCFSHYEEIGLLSMEVGRVSLFAMAVRKLTGKFCVLSL